MSPSDNANPYAAPSLTADVSPPSSGSVHPLLFPVMTTSCLAASLVLAAGLTALFHSGFYLIVLVPLVAGAAIAACVFWAVRFGQCRNRWLGMALGLVCGCVTYFG